jgi:phage head maturation protease
MKRKGKKILVSDESLNSYGFWVLTSGGKFDNFRKNPILLYNHDRSRLPSGTWEDLEIVGTEVYATENVDVEGSEFDKELAGKLDRGVLKTASVGIRALKFSDEPQYLKEGQVLPTVIEWELREISIADIPSNKSSIVLFDEHDNEINLKENGEGYPMPKLHNTKPDLVMNKELLQQLNLSEGASQNDIELAVSRVVTENVTLKAENNRHAQAQIQARKTAIELALNDAEQAGKINATQRGMWNNLLEKDYDNAHKALSELGTQPTMVSLTNVNTTGTDMGFKYNGKTFAELSKESPDVLRNLKENNTDVFKQLYKAQYGVEYKA